MVSQMAVLSTEIFCVWPAVFFKNLSEDVQMKSLHMNTSFLNGFAHKVRLGSASMLGTTACV